MKLWLLKLRRFWATLQQDHRKALSLCLRIKQELEHFMAIETAGLESAISTAVAKLQQDAAAVASAQAALAEAQNASAGDQAKIDALAAQLNAATGA